MRSCAYCGKTVWPYLQRQGWLVHPDGTKMRWHRKCLASERAGLR